jgi:hypothetical protein
MKMAVWDDNRDCLRIGLYSGGAKNLRDSSFGEKVENLGDFGWCGG